MTGLVISKLTAVLLLVSILTLSVLLLLQFPSLATAAHAAVSVMMDGKMYNNNNNALSVKMLDPKTVHIDLFIPPGDHALQIKGIRNAA
jgi:hypothetical protein